MHFIILVASERRNGNCDLLGRYAERYASTSGVNAKLLYLKDFEIKQCQGCMRCVLNSEKCKIEDDIYTFIDVIQNGDALLLLAPTYVLTIPGTLKMVMDRFLCIYEKMKDKPLRPGISIGVCSPIDWNQLQLPLMNLFLLSLGFQVINSDFVYGAGQGEVLLDNGVKMIENSMKNLVEYRPRPYASQISKHCPIDFCTLFERIEGDKFRCPVCLTPAVLKEDGFYFEAKDLNRHRWTKENIRDHFVDWILKTKPRYKTMLKEIIKKKRELCL